MNGLQLLQSGLPPTYTLHIQICGGRKLCALLLCVMFIVRINPLLTHLTLRSKTSFLKPRPNALDPSGVFGVAVGVSTHTLVFLHERVVDQA